MRNTCKLPILLYHTPSPTHPLVKAGIIWVYHLSSTFPQITKHKLITHWHPSGPGASHSSLKSSSAVLGAEAARQQQQDPGSDSDFHDQGPMSLTSDAWKVVSFSGGVVNEGRNFPGRSREFRANGGRVVLRVMASAFSEASGRAVEGRTLRTTYSRHPRDMSPLSTIAL